MHDLLHLGLRRHASRTDHVPAMFVSKVDTGFRFAIGTMFAPRDASPYRSHFLRATLEHRLLPHVATNDRDLDPRAHPPSNTLAVPSLSTETSTRRTSLYRFASRQPASEKPVAPVTNVGRSRQNDVTSSSVYTCSFTGRSVRETFAESDQNAVEAGGAAGSLRYRGADL